LKFYLGNSRMPLDWDQEYIRYKDILKGQRLPLAFVDLDHFDANIAYVARTQSDTGKRIRVASKSIRSLELIKRVFEKGGTVYQGILAFTVEEAAFLNDKGFRDIIIAYPSAQPSDIALLAEKTGENNYIALMVDSLEHLKALSQAGEKTGKVLNACLDIDMSYKSLAKQVHIGVRRSPIYHVEQALAFITQAARLKGVSIQAVMGYEAQIASVNDALPGQGIKNRAMRLLKKQSVKELTSRRQAIIRALLEAGIEIKIVNGGGSGSLISTGKDPSVTEVTAGSAFFAPGLFRYFHEVQFKPAAFFALQVARIPAKGMVTCQGGGYVASGEVSKARLPWPIMPEGLKYLSLEGAGEVQTPLVLPKKSTSLKIGDPVFFQHAKAGELCERFNDLILIKGDRIIDRVKTYRGEGHAFL